MKDLQSYGKISKKLVIDTPEVKQTNSLKRNYLLSLKGKKLLKKKRQTSHNKIWCGSTVIEIYITKTKQDIKSEAGAVLKCLPVSLLA